MITARVGELEDLRYAAPDEAVAVAEEHRDVVVGIKVRLGYQMVGERGLPALRLAREAADRLDLPLMVHIIDLPEPLPEILPLLRGGDIITHCFHGERNGILDGAGRVLPAVRDAAERGVLFDVGHGVGSFSFDGGTPGAGRWHAARYHLQRPARAQHRGSRLRPGRRRSPSSCTWAYRSTR